MWKRLLRLFKGAFKKRRGPRKSPSSRKRRRRRPAARARRTRRPAQSKKRSALRKSARKRPARRRKTQRKVLRKKKKLSRRTSKRVPRLKKAAVGKKGSAAATAEITHYFPKVRAAVLKLDRPLAIGDPVWIKGPKTDFRQTVGSLQIDRKPIEKGRPGEEVGLEVLREVRQGDRVFVIKGSS